MKTIIKANVKTIIKANVVEAMTVPFTISVAATDEKLIADL